MGVDAWAYQPVAVPRKIWICWLQGWEAAPRLVRACMDAWREINPNWEVIPLDAPSIRNFVDLGTFLDGKKIPSRSIANVLRLHLLARYGGVWADATTLPTTALDYWLLPLMQSGFFAFSRPQRGVMVANWFLAAAPDNDAVRHWLMLTQRYWTTFETEQGIRWHRELFEEGCITNKSMRAVWRLTPKISAAGPLLAQRHLLETTDVDSIIAALRDGRIPVHKLDWRLPIPDRFPGTPLAAILGRDALAP